MRGGGTGWRWRLDGALPGLAFEETAGGVRFIGSRVPAVASLGKAPEAAAHGAVLRYAWGDERGWSEVARWYQGLLGQVPRGDETVRRRARQLVTGVGDRRERIATLLEFVRRQVRYVASRWESAVTARTRRRRLVRGEHDVLVRELDELSEVDRRGSPTGSERRDVHVPCADGRGELDRSEAGIGDL